MEAFSLLKYWKGGGGSGGGSGSATVTRELSSNNAMSGDTTTIATAVSKHDAESDDDDDEGPFFDLEFTVPDEDDAEEEKSEKSENAHEGENSNCEEVEGQEEVEVEGENDNIEFNSTDNGERELKIRFSSSSSCDQTSANLNLSLSPPSDDMLFKDRLSPLEDPSLVINSSEVNSKSQLAVSLLRSATKLRVFMSGLKKPKSEPEGQQPKQNQAENQQQPQQEKQNQSKFFTVKFKVEEVPIVSLLTRANGSRSSNTAAKCQLSQKQNAEESAPDEKKNSKDVMQKYLKKVKPLYIRVSKRYSDKIRFSGQLSLSSAAKTTHLSATPPKTASSSSPVEGEADDKEEAAVSCDPKSQKQGNLAVGFRVMCKHLGKSKSASSVVHLMPLQSRRRDDSLLQQQDGIQGAILHCKRSFDASRETESSPLSRSSSDPSREKSSELTTTSSASEERNDVVGSELILKLTE
ncbi:hypothetical protein Nepgr_028550 [Nepenthes gracilis]|uniref:Membrane-associated kinase regulator 2 n=1 Tax=Nepenthes gracilis TaxID=150966 RepID=A0AAD3TC91_NEPGR|nr:hypothetical protein Nepgr_028550 [Nepenthes gracilis]